MKHLILLVSTIFMVVLCAPIGLFAKAVSPEQKVEGNRLPSISVEKRIVVDPKLEMVYKELVGFHNFLEKMSKNISGIESDCHKKNDLLVNIIFDLKKIYNHQSLTYNAMASVFDWTSFEGRKDMPPKVLIRYILSEKKIRASVKKDYSGLSEDEQEYRRLVDFASWFILRRKYIEGVIFGCQKDNDLLNSVLRDIQEGYDGYVRSYNAYSAAFDWTSFEGREDMPPKVILLWNEKPKRFEISDID